MSASIIRRVFIYKIEVLILIFLVNSCLFARSPATSPLDIPIRVGLFSSLGNIKTVRIQAHEGDLRIVFYPMPKTSADDAVFSEEICTVLPEGEHISLEVLARGIIARTSTDQEFPGINGRSMENREIVPGYAKIDLITEGTMTLESSLIPSLMFNGTIEVSQKEGTMTFVNSVNLNDLLLSLASENCPSSEPEAIKAAIVALRTYLLYIHSNPRHASDSFHICDTSHCLNFRGCGKNRPLVKLLIPEVENEVLVHKGRLFCPYIHHTCGGRTANAKEVFGIDDDVHLSKEDRAEGKGAENCFHSPTFAWRRELTKEEMADFLAITYAGGASDIFVTWHPSKHDAAGRILEVEILGKKKKVLTGIEFLQHLNDHFGPKSFPSMRFSPIQRLRTILFEGSGQGSGVGMCLYGADGLAKKNWEYKKILQHYYSNISIVDINSFIKEKPKP